MRQRQLPCRLAPCHDVNSGPSSPGNRPDTAGPRWAQLASVLAARGIRDERVLEAFRMTDRSLFVPPETARRAGRDRPIPLPDRQVTTQPCRIARMLEALSLAGGERVLEVGAGYGYASAGRFVPLVGRYGVPG